MTDKEIEKKLLELLDLIGYDQPLMSEMIRELHELTMRWMDIMMSNGISPRTGLAMMLTNFEMTMKRMKDSYQTALKEVAG